MDPVWIGYIAIGYDCRVLDLSVRILLSIFEYNSAHDFGMDPVWIGYIAIGDDSTLVERMCLIFLYGYGVYLCITVHMTLVWIQFGLDISLLDMILDW